MNATETSCNPLIPFGLVGVSERTPRLCEDEPNPRERAPHPWCSEAHPAGLEGRPPAQAFLRTRALDGKISDAHRRAHFRLLRRRQLHSFVLPFCSIAHDAHPPRVSLARNVRRRG